ncbi:MAG: radical SAM protein, partial [bacterium]
MAVLLISPSRVSLTQSPPVGLGYIASSLRRAGHEVRLADYSLRRFDGEKLAREMERAGITVAGVTSVTPSFPGAVEVVRAIKKRAGDVKTVIGGIHVTALPARSLEESSADFAVVGEGEISFTELVNRLAAGRPVDSIAGVYAGKGDAGRAELVSDIDSLPVPAWDLIPPSRYSAVPWQLLKKGRIVAPISTSRGCPFCAAATVSGRRVRSRRPEFVIDEMKMLVRDYRVDEFHINDDTLNFSRDHLRGFCSALIDSGLGVPWKTPNGVRIDMLDSELVRLMKRAGCYELGFGIETAGADAQKKIGKNLEPGKCREVIDMVRNEGIRAYGFFIFGLPGDTAESIEKTISFAVDSRLDLAHFSLAVPYPGSKLYCDNEKLLRHIPWEYFYHFNPFPNP